MAHGTPDWGLVGPRRTVYGLDDLGEHAVRLGSPHLWDRRGDAIFLTKFAEGLGEVGQLLDGFNAAVALHTGYTRLGAYCVKLTTGDDEERIAGLIKHLPFPVYSALGEEITFGCEVNTDYIELYALVRDLTTTWYPTVRWDPNTGVIQCQIGAVAWYTMTTTQQALVTPSCSNTFKMVFDVVLGTYIRVIANDAIYSLTAQPINSVAAGGAPHFSPIVRHHGDLDENAVAYVDCWIVTQNEP